MESSNIKQMMAECLRNLHKDPSIPKYIKDVFTTIETDSFTERFIEDCELEGTVRAFMTFAIGIMLNAYVLGMARGMEVKPDVIITECPSSKKTT